MSAAECQNTMNTGGAIKLDVFWERMQQMFSRFTENIEAKLDAWMEKPHNPAVVAEYQVSYMKKECNNEPNAIVSQPINEIRQYYYRLDRMERSQELIIKGIPYRRDEDLNEIFRGITYCLGIARTNFPVVHLKRLSKVPLRIESTPPIICQFRSRGSRDDFFQMYLNNRSLTLDNIGYDSQRRIYINENLSPLVKRILLAAIKLRSKGLLYKVSTRKGSVYVRTCLGSEPVIIDTLDQLYNLQSNLSK